MAETTLVGRRELHACFGLAGGASPGLADHDRAIAAGQLGAMAAGPPALAQAEHAAQPVTCLADVSVDKDRDHRGSRHRAIGEHLSLLRLDGLAAIIAQAPPPVHRSERGLRIGSARMGACRLKIRSPSLSVP